VRELFGVTKPLDYREVGEDWGSRVCSWVVSRCTSLQAAPGHSKESCFGSELAEGPSRGCFGIQSEERRPTRRPKRFAVEDGR
jgi:hypothetical protein